MGVNTHAHYAAVKTRDGEKSSGRGDHNGVGVKFICTQKWCMCRPRTTQLDPVSVNTDTPPSHTLTRTQQSRKLTRAWHFSFFFFLLFFPFLLPLLSQDLLHSFGRAFLKLQVWSSLVTKEEDEDGDVCGGALCVHVCVCVCERFTVLCFLLCLWACRSHLDCLLWPDYVMLLCVCVRERERERDYDVMLSSIPTVF